MQVVHIMLKQVKAYNYLEQLYLVKSLMTMNGSGLLMIVVLLLKVKTPHTHLTHQITTQEHYMYMMGKVVGV